METKINNTPAAKTAGVKKVEEQGAQPEEAQTPAINVIVEGADNGEAKGDQPGENPVHVTNGTAEDANGNAEQGAQPEETPAQGTNGAAEGTNNSPDQGANDLEVNDHEVVKESHVYGDKTYTLRENVKQLQFNGKVYSRANLLTNEEIMGELIACNSPFIKKI
jgi:hypothetical protein